MDPADMDYVMKMSAENLALREKTWKLECEIALLKMRLERILKDYERE